MTRLAILALALATTQHTFGKGWSDADIAPYRDAVPTPKQLRIELPVNLPFERDSARGPGETDRALLFELSRTVATSTNQLMGQPLRLMRALVEQEPTAVEHDRVVWGPYQPRLERVSWRLVVKRTGPERFSYLLQKRSEPARGAFHTWVEGMAHEGTSPIFSGYSGELTLHSSTPHPSLGSASPAHNALRLTYDATGRERAVTLAHQPDWAPHALRYAYREYENTAGRFQFSRRADIHTNGSSAEQLQVTATWDDRGAGRARATATGGDLAPDVSARLEECWNPAFERTYAEDTLGLTQRVGNPDTCPLTHTEARYARL
jgi:hypothetical protein